MSKVSEQEMKVSKFYQTLEAGNDSIMPSEKVDAIILKAAVKPNQYKKRNRYFMQLSIAASVVIMVTVALQVTFLKEQLSTENNELSYRKQPMYMLQRSKPVSADEMVGLMTGLLEKGDLEKAKILYKRFKLRYPNHVVNSNLNDALK